MSKPRKKKSKPAPAPKPARARAPKPKAPPKPKKGAKKPRKLPPRSKPLPRKPKPFTPAERSRAARLRARMRDPAARPLSSAERRWLEKYGDRRIAKAAARAARTKAAQRRGAMGDAIDIAKRLADWLGGSYADPKATWREGDEAADFEAVWQERPKAGDPGTAQVTIGVDYAIDEEAPTSRAALPTERPHLAGSLGKGRAMTVRVEMEKDGERRWTTVLAFTPDADLAEYDLFDGIDDAIESYAPDGISAVGVYVGGY